MTDLIQQAEALEAQARIDDAQAEIARHDAADFRAAAAKLREQERDPLRLWMLIGANGDWLGTYDSEGAAMAVAAAGNGRRVVPMVEVRPVRITDAELLEKWASHVLVGHSELAPRLRAFINALSLAGVGVEK